MADDSVGRRMPFAFLSEVEQRVSRLPTLVPDLDWKVWAGNLGTQKLIHHQFTSIYASDEVVAAGSHSLEEFEPELAKVSWTRS
jgi:vesicle-associated membrane protein 7